MTVPFAADEADVFPDDAVLYDPLTGLPGRLLQRAHLTHALRRATRQGTKVAVLVVDLDDFNNINERLGHDVGDEVLVVVAARLQVCLRGNDLPARLGADQFSAVCEDLSTPRDLDVVVRRVSDALASPVQVGDTMVQVRASVGSAMSAHGDRPGQLLNAADRAMADAKLAHRRDGRRGRGRGEA